MSASVTLFFVNYGCSKNENLNSTYQSPSRIYLCTSSIYSFTQVRSRHHDPVLRKRQYRSALWYVVERPACIQWIPDNVVTYVISSSPLSALPQDAGWQACQGDRGINPAAWVSTQVLCRESPLTCAERNGACN